MMLFMIHRILMLGRIRLKESMTLQKSEGRKLRTGKIMTIKKIIKIHKTLEESTKLNYKFPNTVNKYPSHFKNLLVERL